MTLLSNPDTLNSGQLIAICNGLPPARARIVQFSTTGAPRNAAAFDFSSNSTYGNWHFHFNRDKEVPDAVDTFFVTLEGYRGRKRHVLFEDPATAEDKLGNDLPGQTKQNILDWAQGKLTDQLGHSQDMPSAEYQTAKIKTRLKAAADQRRQDQQAQEAAAREAKRLQDAIASAPPLEAYVAALNQDGTDLEIPFVNAMKIKPTAQALADSLNGGRLRTGKRKITLAEAQKLWDLLHPK